MPSNKRKDPDPSQPLNLSDREKGVRTPFLASKHIRVGYLPPPYLSRAAEGLIVTLKLIDLVLQSNVLHQVQKSIAFLSH